MLEKNENGSSEIVETMQHLRTNVPTDERENPIHLLSGGDLLTCEREINALEDRCNATTAKGCIEGLIPCLEDFHIFGNLLGVSIAQYEIRQCH